MARPSRLRRAFSGTYLALIIAFLYLPILVLIVLSFNASKSRAHWGGFTLDWYVQMFQSSTIMNALYNSLTIALFSAVISTVIGVLACVGITAMSRGVRTTVLTLNNIPMLNAEIVTGLSLMICFGAFGISLGYGTILVSHVAFCLPYVILSVMPRLKQSNASTYEAALDLGAGPVQAFFKVVLPEIMPGIVAGFLLAFTMSLDDFVISYFTRGRGVDTLSTLIYSQVRRGVVPSMYALSTLIFVVVLVILLAQNFLPSYIQKKRDKARAARAQRELDQYQADQGQAGAASNSSSNRPSTKEV
jgi:spermidine/putrescine transport system permease protein